MTQIEKIKNELKRRIERCNVYADIAAEENLHNTLEANELAISLYNDILSFIESLENKNEKD